MRKFSLIYGGIAGAIVILVLIIGFELNGGEIDFEGGEVYGYLSMVVALSLLFFGIRNYRNKVQNGSIKFGKAFLLGLYMSLVASVVYAAGWMVYYEIGALDFAQEYARYQIELLDHESMSEADYKAALDRIQMSQEMYQNPFFRFFITTLEILPIGLLVSLISALILKRSKQEPEANLQV